MVSTLAQATGPAESPPFWPQVRSWLVDTVVPHIGTLGLAIVGVAVLLLILHVWANSKIGVAGSQIVAMIVGAFVLVALMIASPVVEWGTIIRLGLATMVAIEFFKVLSLAGLARLAITSSALGLIIVASVIFYRLVMGSFATIQWPFTGVFIGSTASYGLFHLESVLHMSRGGLGTQPLSLVRNTGKAA